MQYLKVAHFLISFFSIKLTPTLTIAYCISLASSIPCMSMCMFACFRSNASYAFQKLSWRHSWVPATADYACWLGFWFSPPSTFFTGCSSKDVIAYAMSEQLI